MPSYSGSPTGAGNPPGKYSDSYLTAKVGKDGNFVTDANYEKLGGLNRKESPPEVGNQPKEKSQSDLAGPKQSSI